MDNESRSIETNTRRNHINWLVEITGSMPPCDSSHIDTHSPLKSEYRQWLSDVSRNISPSIAGGTPSSIEPVLFEAFWDPTKHPRLGGPPNAGWFAATTSSLPRTLHKAREPKDRDHAQSLPKSRAKLRIQQVAWIPSVGHHWNPCAAIFSDSIRPFLSQEAVEYALGSYSGELTARHGYGTYGGVSHAEYNSLVRAELESFIKLRNITKMSPKQMEEFISLIEHGLDAAGKPHGRIAAFNNAIKKLVRPGTIVPRRMNDVIDAGRKYMKHSRFRFLAAGAVISGVLTEALRQQVNILDVASSSHYYRNAMKALEAGDLDRAQRLLIGNSNSLYFEILAKVGAHAALDFKRKMELVFATAQNGSYK